MNTKVPVWDVESDTVIEIEIDEECLREMDRVSQEYEDRRRACRQKERELERYDRE